MRVSTIALIAALATLAGTSQASLDFPILNSCTDSNVNPIAFSLNTSSCKDMGFSALVASLIQATGVKGISTNNSVSPADIQSILPAQLSQNSLSDEHIQFIEQLSPDFKFVRQFNSENLSESISSVEGGSSFAFVLIREDDGSSSIALFSDAVDDGSEAIRVIHPTKGYVAVDVDSIVDGFEFSYDTTIPIEAGELTSPNIPFSYPKYSQCDSRWKNNMMVNKTVCAVGCLMSSVSMAIGGHNVQFKVGGTVYNSNPGSFNQFVRTHGGYVGNNLFVHGVVNQVCKNSPSRGCNISFPRDGNSYNGRGSLSISKLQHFISTKRAVVGNVHNGGHFVLLVGWDKSNSSLILSNDPSGGVNKYYRHTDIVGYKIYDMKGPRLTDSEDYEPVSISTSESSKPWRRDHKKRDHKRPERHHKKDGEHKRPDRHHKKDGEHKRPDHKKRREHKKREEKPSEEFSFSTGYDFNVEDYEFESNSFEEIDAILDSIEYM